ncbi:MAG TPA: hypothetical protein VMT87_14485 [Vicinamibacteria bacterium]|nr:hypothetical protein [Vicinamibacteria bacterium]
MTARLVSVAPLLAALLLYAGLALPLRARAGEARDAYGQARRARQQAQAELAPLERREAAWRRAAAVAAGGEEGEPAALLRRRVLATVDGSSATAVRLGVRPGPRGPTVRVSATAPFAEAVRLSGELARPGTGLILERVELRPRADRGHVALLVEALALRARP